MAQEQTKVTDPVCGMSIDPKSAAGSSQYEGKSYYFCSKACKTKFDGNPRQFAESSGPARGARG